jgi:hypothetical protein
MFRNGAGKLRALAAIMMVAGALLTAGALSAHTDGIGPRTGRTYTETGCCAYGAAYLQTTSGQDLAGSKHYGYAYGVLDPTWSYQVFNVVPSQDIATIDQMWAVLTTS